MKRTCMKWRMVCLFALLVSGAVNLQANTSAIRFISHRGESADASENTMAAFRLAAERKTAGCECDSYLTANGEIVCIHDSTTSDLLSPGNTVYLGGHTGNTPGVGVWDEVRIFNRVLSAEEIESLAHKFANGTTMRIQ